MDVCADDLDEEEKKECAKCGMVRFEAQNIVIREHVSYAACMKWKEYEQCLKTNVPNVDCSFFDDPAIIEMCPRVISEEGPSQGPSEGPGEEQPVPTQPGQATQPVPLTVSTLPAQTTLAVTNTTHPSIEICGKGCDVNMKDGKLDMPKLKPAGKKGHEKSCKDFKGQLDCVEKTNCENGEIEKETKRYEKTCDKSTSGAMTSGICPLFLLVANVCMAVLSKML